jgi:hypothetical protein
MTLSPIRIPLLASASLGAQSFIQMSDPQFGMFSKDADFVHETANFEFAIAAPPAAVRPPALRTHDYS